MGKNLEGKKLCKGISQRKDGVYVARAIVKGESICLYGKNYQKLKKELDEKKLKILSGLSNEPDYTVEEWFNEWFDLYKVPHIKEISIAPMKNCMKRTFLPYIGNKKLKDLKSKDLQIVIKTLLEEKKIARSSVAEAIGRLTECFASAVNNQYMLTNPAFDLCLPFKEEIWQEQRWLRVDETKVFLNTAQTEYTFFYPMLYTMIYTGLRVGEVGGLKWEDVDFKSECLNIRNNLSVEYKNGVKRMELTTLKTPNSYRKIPFMGKMKEILTVQREQVETLKKTLGNRYRGKDEFEELVFVTTMGSPMIRHNAEKLINKLVDTINFNEAYAAKEAQRVPVYFEKAYPHALRHTFASLCYMAKFDVKVTQSLMGHAHLSTTMDIYTHFGEVLSEESIRNFNMLLE